MVRQRTGLVNALRAALREYYPAPRQVFEDWTMPAAWAFVQRFPTPPKLAAAGQRAWEKFLHTHKLARPETHRRRIECFAHATHFCRTEPVTSAKSLLALSLVAQLQALRKQLKGYRHRINELFDRHPRRRLFDSLPGLGQNPAARLLSQSAGARRRYERIRQGRPDRRKIALVTTAHWLLRCVAAILRTGQAWREAA